jgi:hypothetical protein
MEASRGRKGKKTRWQLSLGVKEVIFATLGVLGLIMMSFALGTLAGRGDIYRVLANWGVLSPEATKIAQYIPPTGPPTPAPPLTQTVSDPSAAVPVATATPLATGPAAAKPAPAPVTGSIAAVSGNSASQKKPKGSSLHREQKAKEEELRKVRQEVASKLKFQNSLDTSPKTARTAQKPKEKAATPQATKVKVGQFRDQKAAKAKVAELEKKGIKASLKQGKDAKGPLYTVYKQAPQAAADGEHVAQKPQKTEEKKAKKQDE